MEKSSLTMGMATNDDPDALRRYVVPGAWEGGCPDDVRQWACWWVDEQNDPVAIGYFGPIGWFVLLVPDGRSARVAWQQRGSLSDRG